MIASFLNHRHIVDRRGVVEAKQRPYCLFLFLFLNAADVCGNKTTELCYGPWEDHHKRKKKKSRKTKNLMKF